MALDQLGVDEQEADIEVVQEPQTGLFGRLKVEAKVKARIRPTTPRAKVDRRDRKRRNTKGRSRKGGGSNGRPQEATVGSSGGDGGRSTGKQNGNGGRDAPASSAAKPSSGDNGGSSSTAGEQQRKKQQGQSRSSSTSSGSSGRRRRGGGQQQGGNRVADTSTSDHEAAPVADTEAQREAVVEFLGGLLTAMDRSDANVDAQLDDEGTIVAEVNGDELGLLVGPKGQTLQAMHELTRSVVQRRFVGESHARINLDVAGYRKRRAEALARFTQKLADDVIATGATKALDPMSASDRKVVHDTANEIDGVRTFSEGDEPNRRVVIAQA